MNEFEEKLNELYYSIIDRDKYGTKRLIKFSDGQKVRQWIDIERARLELLASEDERASVILNSYLFDDFYFRVREFNEFILSNGFPFDGQTFKDGTLFNVWFKQNYDRLLSSNISETKNIIKSFYGTSNYQLYIDRIDEVFCFLMKNKFLPYGDDSDDIELNDGISLKRFIYRYKKRLKLMAPFNDKIKFISSKLYLSFEEKLNEFCNYALNYFNNEDWLNNAVFFKDGYGMRDWFYNYKKELDILAKSSDDIRQAISRVQIKNYKGNNNFREKLIEVVHILCDLNYIPSDDEDITFKDGTNVGNWLHANKRLILLGKDDDLYTNCLYVKLCELDSHTFDKAIDALKISDEVKRKVLKKGNNE